MKNQNIFGLFGLIIVISFMSGCQSTTTVQTNSTATTNSAVSKPAETGKAATDVEPSKKPEEKSATSDQIESVYSDITSGKCKTTDKNEEEAWSVQLCDGVAGYKLEITEADIRQSVSVISPGGKKSDLNLQQTVSSAFSSLGEKAEWRMMKKDGKSVPFAMIVRLNASKGDDGTKTDSFLVVSKIDGDKSCVTDVVKPMANANEEARKLADNSTNKPCKN